VWTSAESEMLPGWEMRLMSTLWSVYAPRWMSLIFPPPPSSAGVPNRTTLPGREERDMVWAVASAAATDALAMRLWPQAWPIVGRASWGLVSCKLNVIGMKCK